jgi:hypothetical protein
LPRLLPRHYRPPTYITLLEDAQGRTLLHHTHTHRRNGISEIRTSISTSTTPNATTPLTFSRTKAHRHHTRNRHLPSTTTLAQRLTVLPRQVRATARPNPTTTTSSPVRLPLMAITTATTRTRRTRDSTVRHRDNMDRRRDNTASRDSSRACTTSKGRRRRVVISKTTGNKAVVREEAFSQD